MALQHNRRIKALKTVVRGADDRARSHGDLPAHADESAGGIHRYAGTQRRILPQLQNAVPGVELASASQPDSVREAHVSAVLQDEAASETDLAAGRKERTPQDKADSHAKDRGNPA